MNYLIPFFLMLAMLFSIPVFGQNAADDKAHLQKVKPETASLYSGSNNDDFMQVKSSSLTYFFNNEIQVLRYLMLAYQHLVSPQLFSDCAFELSCSNYSKKCIAHYGGILGIFLSADRLMRCNPYTSSELRMGHKNLENNKLIDDPKDYHLP